MLLLLREKAKGAWLLLSLFVEATPKLLLDFAKRWRKTTPITATIFLCRRDECYPCLLAPLDSMDNNTEDCTSENYIIQQMLRLVCVKLSILTTHAIDGPSWCSSWPINADKNIDRESLMESAGCHCPFARSCLLRLNFKASCFFLLHASGSGRGGICLLHDPGNGGPWQVAAMAMAKSSSSSFKALCFLPLRWHLFHMAAIYEATSSESSGGSMHAQAFTPTVKVKPNHWSHCSLFQCASSRNRFDRINDCTGWSSPIIKTNSFYGSVKKKRVGVMKEEKGSIQ